MDDERMLAELLELAGVCGLAVRWTAAGAAPQRPGGALIRLKGQDILVLAPDADPAETAAVVAAALAGRPELEDRFLPPAVREILGGHGGDGRAR
jgi:hypothetical protein